jgi:NADH-quinone oxidoreductase subunit N
MLSTLAAAAWESPVIDWHALAPEIVLTATVCIVLIVDVVLLEKARPVISALAGLGLLATAIPLLTLATSDVETRELFGGAYVVDQNALLLKALFIGAAYLVILMSTNYIAEGDYWESEYYTLLIASVLGMSVMASARDLISIFVALELLSIPAYMLAAWRKGDNKSNEAGAKYYLMGVFASAVLLYGMSLLYGLVGSTKLSDIGEAITGQTDTALILAVIFVIVGFGFKVSAVPFHQWAPDTYEGAPTPVTAYLATASKAAGFVALINVIFYAFIGVGDIFRPLIFVLSALSMTVGNLIALRQTNIVRMLAYSGIAQAGFILAPFAVADQSSSSLTVIIVYLVIYAVMNLGAFAVVMALARKTGSAEISSMAGAFKYAPGLTVLMTIFLASLIGIPPLAGWYAKFGVILSLAEAGTWAAYGLIAFVVLNTVIAAVYYLNVAKTMWFDEVPDEDLTPVSVPPSQWFALSICAFGTLLFGILPGLLTNAASGVEIIAGL